MATQAPSKTPQGRTIKEKRITARVTETLKDKVEEAAMISGRTVTDFIVEAIQEKADDVIHKHHLLELSLRDMDALIAAIESPPEPNAALRRSLQRWREHGAPA